MTQTKVTPAQGKLGILVVGCGAVSTTFITGVLMARKGLTKPVGSMTQYDKIRVGRGADARYLHYADIVPLAKLDDIVFGCWDVYPQNAYQAAMYAEVLKEKDIEPVRDELEKIVPMPAAFDKNYAKRLDGDNVKCSMVRSSSAGLQGKNGQCSMVNGQCSMVNVQCALDLCAAPGGKSTALRSVLPDDCVLISNEPMGNRAQILLENVTKWGGPNHIVTNNYPRDFRKAKLKFFDKRSGTAGFDLILCDVPCSGEGMFRKDPNAISEWSAQNVEKCWQLQREIVADAWECLNPGGLLIYSTCTYNTKENEENIRWILDTYDAQVLDIPVDPSWNITGSLLEGFNEPVYRFIPGITRGEGLFVCALRKNTRKEEGERSKEISSADIIKNKNLKVLDPGILLPPSSLLPPKVDVDYAVALKYLRGEALVLPADTPRGIVTITYQGQALGPAKNIGNRANNLYPKPWRIKSTHLPDTPPEILMFNL